MIGIPYQVDEFQASKQVVEDALHILKEKSPNLFSLFNLVIHSIFFAHSPCSGVGSVSSGLGVLWLNNRSHWSQQDLIELLIHEMTHTLIFIDEVVHLHITDYKLVADPNNFAQSAILGVKRPVDKVYHSIIVSLEVIESRLNFLADPINPKVHPETIKLIHQTKDSINSLYSSQSFERIFTNRSKELMALCKQKILELEQRLEDPKIVNKSIYTKMAEAYTSVN